MALPVKDSAADFLKANPSTGGPGVRSELYVGAQHQPGAWHWGGDSKCLEWWLPGSLTWPARPALAEEPGEMKARV